MFPRRLIACGALLLIAAGCQSNADRGAASAAEAQTAFASSEGMGALLAKRWPLWAIHSFCTPERQTDPGWQNLVADSDIIWKGTLYDGASDFDKIAWYATTENGRAVEYSLKATRGKEVWVLEIGDQEWVQREPQYAPNPAGETRFVGR